MAKKIALLLIFQILLGMPGGMRTMAQVPADHEYYPEGNLKKEIIYGASESDPVLIREYFPTGRLMQEYRLQDGKGEGLAQIFYESGKLKAEAGFKKGNRDGHWKMFDENERLTAEGDFHDGSGKEKEYFPGGAVRIITEYKNNQPHGTRVEFYESGRVKFEDTFKDGEILRRKKFTEAGALAFDQKYQGGALGRSLSALWENLNQEMEPEIIREYDDAGHLKKEIVISFENPYKQVKGYYANGILQYEEIYRDGELVDKKSYDEEGKLIRREKKKGARLTQIRDKKMFHTEGGGLSGAAPLKFEKQSG